MLPTRWFSDGAHRVPVFESTFVDDQAYMLSAATPHGLDRRILTLMSAISTFLPGHGFEVNFAKSALGGLLSLFFVSGTKAHDIDFFEHRKATIGNGNNLLRHGN